MKCQACGNNLSEAEQKINEWGFLETMCKECLEIGRCSVYDSDVFEMRLMRQVEEGYDDRVPGWASYIQEVKGIVIAFERKPLWDEDKEEWIVAGGKTQVISNDGEDTVMEVN